MRRRSRWVFALLAAAGVAAAVAAPAAIPAAPPSGAVASAPGAAAGGKPAGGSGHPTAPQPAGGHLSGAPSPDPADIASPEAIVAAYYGALSGPPGKRRDWNRFLSLFFPGARLLPAEGKGHAGVMPMAFSPEQYLFNTEPSMMQTGYVATETARRSERFGKIVHVWSTFRVVRAGEARPLVRGVNSFQLVSDGSRWWIWSVLWQPETATLKLPPEPPR